ncbi:MAG: putative porin [Microscillaceae bacterium]|nr:putative porin [Microscillaceae bacterium]
MVQNNLMKRILCFCGLLGGLGSFPLTAQILDDSTQQVYGPKTTAYYQELDVLEGKAGPYGVDTSLHNFHRYFDTQKQENLSQNLGTFASIMRPLFFDPSPTLGTRLGLDGYDFFTFFPENIRYFDTKSPFTQAYYVQGANSDTEIHFLFARNINPRWNIGFHYVRQNTNRVFGTSQPDDRLVDALRFVAFTGYSSENGKYRILYHLSALNHDDSETGGVEPNPALPNEGFYSNREADAQLDRTARSRQSRTYHHLYQQYALNPAFTIYQTLDIRRQLDEFKASRIRNYADFYPPAQPSLLLDGEEEAVAVFNFNGSLSNESTIFRLYENKFGIKGKLTKFNYRLYFQSRVYQWDTGYEGQLLRRLNSDSSTASARRIEKRLASGFENFVGGTLFYQFSDSSRLETEAVLRLGRDYRLQAVFRNRLVEARFLSTLYTPSLFQQVYLSNHFEWNNAFSNTLVNEVSGQIHWRNRRQSLYFAPQGRYAVVNNYIYFDSLAVPRQTSDFIQILQVGARIEVVLGRWHWESLALFTANTGDDFLRMPDILVNAQVYCQDCLLKKFLHTQIGLDVHYKSGYFADAYMPVTKQFYLQDRLFVEGYPIVDIFMNVKIQNFRVFLKLAHANQLPEAGYLTTPFYPGLARTFVFGIDWMFFK